jgi:hypothetical protein
MSNSRKIELHPCSMLVLTLVSGFLLVGCGALGHGGGGKNLTDPATGLTATAGNAQVILNWNAYPGASSYNIWRGTSSTGPGTGAIDYLPVSPTATSYTDFGLTNGTTYYYEVNANGSWGVSNFSNQVSATPSSVTATITSVSPSSVMAGGPSFALTLSGSNLAPGNDSILVWNGSQQISAVGKGQYPGNPTQATYMIDASLIASPGSVSLAVIDANNGKQLSNSLTFTMTPLGPTTCALFGTYEFLFTGFGSSYQGISAGVLGVDAGGNISGAEDAFSGPSGTFAGTCTNSTTPNQGTLTFTPTSNSGSTTSSTFVLQQGGNGLSRGRLVDVEGTNSRSGVFVTTSPDAFLKDGDYIFGAVGEDPYGDGGVGTQLALAGRFTLSNGSVSGVADMNDGGVLTSNVAVSGTSSMQTGDTSNEILSLTIGGQTASFGVYLNSSGGGFLLGSNFMTVQHLVGFISPQANAGSYNNSSLNAPFVFSTWGASPPLCCLSINPSKTDTTLGLASGFNSATGTFNLLFDNVSAGVANLNQSITGATYNVASNGRATVSFTSGGNTVNDVYYLDDVNDGFILEQSGNTSAFGFFQPQASDPFSTASINGTLAAATFSPMQQVPTPTLATEITLNNGGLSASTPAGALSGTYTIAPSGRGTASVNLPVLGTNDWVLYVIDPQNVVVMGSDNTTANAIMYMHF